MTKIGDIVQFYSPLSGGVKRYVHEKMRGFAQMPDVDHFVIVPSQRAAMTVRHRTRVYEVPCPLLPGSRSYRALVSGRHVRDIIAREAPDLIEVGDPYRVAWIALRLAREREIPIVSYYHSDYPRAFGRTVAKYAGATAARLVDRAVGPYLLNLYRRMTVTVAATDRYATALREFGIPRVVKIPLGVDTRVFRPAATRPGVLRELGLAAETRLLMYAGRLAREKNVRSLLALMELFAPGERMHLLIVGDGESRAPVQAACAARNDITWMPYCEETGRLADLYAAADVFVHPGASETFGLVSIEAQACGTPVVAVKGSGVDETLRSGLSGALAAGPGPECLAAAVRDVLRPGRDEAARRERHAWIAATFSSATMCDRLKALYESLCAPAAATEKDSLRDFECAPLLA